jgi:hypothetical protein
MAVRKKALVANAMETVREGVEQKTSNELTLVPSIDSAAQNGGSPEND